MRFRAHHTCCMPSSAATGSVGWWRCLGSCVLSLARRNDGQPQSSCAGRMDPEGLGSSCTHLGEVPSGAVVSLRPCMEGAMVVSVHTAEIPQTVTLYNWAAGLVAGCSSRILLPDPVLGAVGCAIGWLRRQWKTNAVSQLVGSLCPVQCFTNSRS